MKQNLEKLLLPISVLRGVGPALNKLLSRLVVGDKIIDLLLHKPLRCENISISPRLFEAQNNQLIIVKAKVETHSKPAKPNHPYKVICYNPSGYINLVFFKIFPSQIAKMKVGEEIVILGNLQKLGGENQIIHPQEILPVNEIEKLPKVNVIYPLIAGITQRFINQKIAQVLSKVNDENDEWIDERFLKQQGWSGFIAALKELHFFEKNSNQSNSQILKRLAYDELLSWQIAVLLAKKQKRENKNFSKPQKNLCAEFLKSLPFQTTKSQISAIKEIAAEIFSDKKMLRLLQGDVGSGKTIVAICACLNVIAQNKQACVIAPTTVLAKQHFGYFKNFLEKFDLKIELLTSATTKKQKQKILQDLSLGKIDILIGTHAVIEDNIKFKNLALAVIDEQHRFGVLQRLKLTQKGENVDVLLMSATPIPRSLMMALYGDMDISVLNEKPKNRQKIETLIMSQEKKSEINQAIKRAIDKGEKIYWICPAIDEIDNENEEKPIEIFQKNLAGVIKKHEELSKIFGTQNVGLLHGQMKEKDKEKVMHDFAHDSLQILVATTVIEVGIDVPDATIILIENSEHFGLSQLHQLRGRVGRSDKKSFCILLYGKEIGKNGRRRLEILRNSDDGFFIAEEDLKMRGSGELLGTKQSGFPEFKIADLNFDSDLLKIAHKNAELILHHDDNLSKVHSEKYRLLLRLFKYDECLKIIAGG